MNIALQPAVIDCYEKWVLQLRSKPCFTRLLVSSHRYSLATLLADSSAPCIDRPAELAGDTAPSTDLPARIWFVIMPCANAVVQYRARPAASIEIYERLAPAIPLLAFGAYEQS